jgi:hypothetical protein
MTRRLFSVTAFCAPLLAGLSARAIGADENTAESIGEVATGLANHGLATIIIAAAAVLLSSLLLRGATVRLSRVVSRKFGERRIRLVLRRRSPDILQDFILPGVYGGLTHIDYAVLTSGGILCIQTKHYNGTVVGGDDEPQWQNVDGTRRQRFLNPLIQNAGRTKAVQRAVPGVPTANLVVFTGSVHLTATKSKNVVHVRDLDSYISKFVFGPCKIKDWDAVWLTLKAAALTDEDSRKDFHAQLSFS